MVLNVQEAQSNRKGLVHRIPTILLGNSTISPLTDLLRLLGRDVATKCLTTAKSST